jgi:hypothetical protein
MGCSLGCCHVMQAKAKPGAVKDLSPAQLQQLVTKLIKENKALKAEIAGEHAACRVSACAVVRRRPRTIQTDGKQSCVGATALPNNLRSSHAVALRKPDVALRNADLHLNGRCP